MSEAKYGYIKHKAKVLVRGVNKNYYQQRTVGRSKKERLESKEFKSSQFPDKSTMTRQERMDWVINNMKKEGRKQPTEDEMKFMRSVDLQNTSQTQDTKDGKYTVIKDKYGNIVDSRIHKTSRGAEKYSDKWKANNIEKTSEELRNDSRIIQEEIRTLKQKMTKVDAQEYSELSKQVIENSNKLADIEKVRAIINENSAKNKRLNKRK